MGTGDRKGQTYAQYVKKVQGKYVVTNTKKRILIYPICDFGAFDEILPIVERYTKAFFPGCKVIRKPVMSSKGITKRDNYYGQQLLTGDIHNKLNKVVKNNTYAVMAISMKDLYPRDSWNFVFGQASFKRRTGVFSFCRYKISPDEELPENYDCIEETDLELGTLKGARAAAFLRRCFRVVSHELGHLFGMSHCIHFQCLMNGSNSMTESDDTPCNLCPICLRKLHYALTDKTRTKVNLVDRYKNLLEIYKEYGMVAEYSWVENRLKTADA